PVRSRCGPHESFGDTALVLTALRDIYTIGAPRLGVYMPQAKTPADVSRLIGETITSGDLDAAMSLYEPEATFAMPAGFGEGSVTGLDELRGVLSGFLAMGPELKV